MEVPHNRMMEYQMVPLPLPMGMAPGPVDMAQKSMPLMAAAPQQHKPMEMVAQVAAHVHAGPPKQPLAMAQKSLAVPPKAKSKPAGSKPKSKSKGKRVLGYNDHRTVKFSQTDILNDRRECLARFFDAREKGKSENQALAAAFKMSRHENHLMIKF